MTRAGYLQDHLVISGFRVTPAVGFVQPGFDLQLDGTEVEDVFEVPLEFVLDPRNHLPRDRSVAGHTSSRTKSLTRAGRSGARRPAC